jgi:hypothetical protein
VTPPGDGPHAVVIFLGDEGTSAGPESDRAAAAFGSFAAVVTCDLPLCGARHSDKLSAAFVDRSHGLHEILQTYARDQLPHDIDSIAAALDRHGTRDPNRTALVAVGRSAHLLTTLPTVRLCTQVIDPEATATQEWLEATAAKLRLTLLAE